MIKRLKKWMENQKRRTTLIILCVCLLVAAMIIFIEIELEYNRKVTIDNYQTEQQLLTDQVALRMESYLSAQSDITEVINQLIKEVVTSGSRYWFIARDDQLLFVKNQETTELFTYISLPTFLKESSGDAISISYSSFTYEEKKYTIGSCTKIAYIEEAGQTFRHNIYVIMPLIVVDSVMIALFFFGLLTISRQKNKIQQLNEEAIQRNITIEHLSSGIKKTRLNNLGGKRGYLTEEKEKPIYSKEVLSALLSKINRENVVPLTIVVIELSSKTKGNAEDYHAKFKSVSKLIKKEHVLAEIIPGVFTVLLFHTMAENMEDMKKTLVNQWALPLQKKGIKVRMGITCIEDYDSDVENVFEIVYREVSGEMQMEDRLRASS